MFDTGLKLHAPLFAPRMSSAEELWKDNSRKWVPLKSGGDFRKWYGNNEKVIRFDRVAYNELKSQGNHCASEDRYFQESLTWSAIGATDQFGVRLCDEGFVFTTGSHSIFATDAPLKMVAAYLCSSVASYLAQLINPTLNANPGDIARLPFPTDPDLRSPTVKIAEECIRIAKLDWDSFEVSWDFERSPLIEMDQCRTIEHSWSKWRIATITLVDELRQLEERNNQLFTQACSLESDSYIAERRQRITLKCNASDRYGPEKCESEGEALLCADAIRELTSYAIGCMMGRYSLDKPGLIYANSRNQGFDASQYKTFPADLDGIIPLTDTAWCDDDAANRLIEFIGVTWPKEHLEENLKFIAESLGSSKGEQSRDAIRRYLAQDFFKDHLKTYKRRPIYWLFSSGKQRAFQCLVYLHRYNEGTLSRMRTEYVIPLQGKISARIEQLAGDIAAATSTAFRSKLTKERDKLIKQQAELQAFDEKLRHNADLRVSLDLDDGVKVNYGKFGDLLAEVKSVTGGSDE